MACAMQLISVANLIMIFAVPAPISVMLLSSIPNPIPPFGSDVTLTCAVELSPAVDIPVTINVVLTRPDGFMRASIAQSVMGSSTNYTSTFMISPFGRSDSGIYVCAAASAVSLPSNAYISGSSAVTHSLRVTIGEMFTILLLLCFDNQNCIPAYLNKKIPQVFILH